MAEKKKVTKSIEEIRSELDDAVVGAMRKALNTVGVATTQDIKELDARISAVEKKVAKKPAKKRAAAKKRKAPAKKKAAKKPAKKKSAGRPAKKI
ncbi:MAG: hypothetical protein KKA28_18715 [Planctomycetes bacterium]|nr:hypothetical protein [Planctomycetota bacterium]